MAMISYYYSTCTCIYVCTLTNAQLKNDRIHFFSFHCFYLDARLIANSILVIYSAGRICTENRTDRGWYLQGSNFVVMEWGFHLMLGLKHMSLRTVTITARQRPHLDLLTSTKFALI